MKISVRGEGPTLVLIECNVPWQDALVDGLSRWATVVTVAPTGFASADRLEDPAGYTTERFERELLEAARAGGAERFSMLGYSMSAAFATWLARRCDLVDVVVAGGFPIYGDYRLAFEHVRDRLDRRDEAQLGADPDAARVFWEALAELDDEALAHPASARLAVFYGTADDLVERVGGLERLGARSRADGWPVAVLEGATHAGGHERLDELSEWIRGCVAP
jgi:pimeloyl-ACP methyl ester carboxylesterase